MIHNIEKRTLGLNYYMNSLFTFMISMYKSGKTNS